MRTTVLVTGVGGGGHGEQILKALRLAEYDYEIIVADMTAASTGFASARYRYTLPPASDPEYTDALLNICRHHDVVAVCHGSEPELKRMSMDRERIELAGIFLPINPS